MRILTRYVLKEVLSHAALGTALFTFVIFMRDVSRIMEIVVRASAPLPSVFEIFFFTLPMAFTVTIPMGVLVGILIGLSRLAADSEVTAIRAGGMGAWTFVRIISIFAIAAFAFALVNSVYLAPKSAAALARLQNELRNSQASFQIQPRVFYEEFKNYVLYVQDVSSGSGASVWRKVFLADITTPGAPKITLAEEAIVIPEDNETIRLHLRNGAQHESAARNPAQYTISTFQETDIPIRLPQPQAQQRAIPPTQQISTAGLLEVAANEKDPASARYFRTEFHRRLALPFSCLVLALVGVPLGLSAKKGGKSTGFVLTILLVFVYYLVSLAGVAMSRSGTLPPEVAVWGANALFALTGLILLVRVDRMPIELGSVRAFLMNLRTAVMRRLERRKRGEQLAATGEARAGYSSRFPLILDEYIIRDFLKYVFMVLAAFVTLMIVFTFFELLGDIIRNRVSLFIVGEYLLMVTPGMLYLMTPLSVLIATLVTFGLLEKTSEVTAMKAVGMSVYRLIVPVLVLSMLVAGALFFFDQAYLPYANKRQEVLRNTIKGKPAQTYLRPDRKWIVGQNNTIYYYEFFDPDRGRFGSVSAFEFDPKTFQIVRRVYGTRAHWEDDLNKWVFEQGWTRAIRGEAIEEFRTYDVATFQQLNEPPSYFKKEFRQSSEMSLNELRGYIKDLRQSGFDVVRLEVQLHRKFAYPLITFVMAVLAVPFSLSAGRRGALTGITVAIGIAMAYWVIAGLFEQLGNVNQLPPSLAAWTPDILFALLGGYLILKVPT